MQTRSRSLVVLLFDEVELFEVAAVLSVVSVAGRHWNWRPFKVTAVAEEPGNVATRSQLTIAAPAALSECPAPEVVLVPGGYGARRALARPAVVEWLRGACQSAEHVLAVGNGVLLLGKTGALAGQEVAARGEIQDELRDLDASVAIRDSLTESGKFSSVAESGGSLELALRLVQRVLGPKLANGAAQALGVPWIAGDVPGISGAGQSR